MEKRITIIHPSRSRPDICLSVIKNWLSKADNIYQIEYIVSVDSSDPFIGLYEELIEPSFLHVADNKSAIEAINIAATVSNGSIMVVCSDDFDCPENWDTDLIKHLKGKSDFVVKTWDGCQPWIITLPIMDRVYYNRFGYIYHPGYKHMFCDTEMTHVADLLDRKIEIPMIFNHKHYSQQGGIPKDAVSVKNDSTWAQGEKLYLERMMRNFDLPPSQIKGNLRCGKPHIKWLESRGIILQYA